ncbi:Transposon TX1 uncharacterized 149 kDa protein [Vitis vinifera]|uniref:Transposon TX1 uncharacterized 149 kDa protein n=1 Tax=Vitis vinifera TaxID=29760 RepID=A0A438I248_VITVI|nr:Transposon TX1 uncharacterized 149 kDa protein [Vitis vinifera]
MGILRRAILSVQDYSDQVGEELKKMFGNNQMSKSIYRGGRSYAEVVAEDGIRSGVPLSAGKWVRAVICECKEKVQDWTHEGKAIARMLGVKGMVSINPISAFKGCFFVSTSRKSKMVTRAGETFSERKACSPKKMVAKRKYDYSWKIQKGLVAREAVKLLDLTKVKLWVEMHPNVVLPALLEVEDGAWKHTVAVSVIGEEGEDGNVTSETSHCRYEWLKEGGLRLSDAKICKRGYEVVSGVMSATVGSFFPGHVIGVRVQAWRPKGERMGRAQIGLTSRLLCKSDTQPRSGDERADVEVILGEDGRADEFQAQTSSNPSPPSETEEVSRGRKRSEKGESSNGSDGRLHIRGKDDGSREMWSKLFLPSVASRHRQRSSSKTLPYGAQRHFAKSASGSGWRDGISTDTRYQRESHLPLSSTKEMQQLVRRKKPRRQEERWNRQKSQLKDDKGGFTGRAGYDPCGSSVTVSPSIPRTRGDVGPLNFVGIPVHVEEENQRAVSNQMSERSTPGKSSNLMPGSPGVNEASPPEDFLIDGMSPRKMAKVREVLCSLDIKVYSRRKNRGNKKGEVRQKLGAVSGRSKIRIGLFSRRVGASGGILFIWDSKKLCKEEVVLGSFSISVKFALEGCGPLWISVVYGPNSPSLRKDFWVELYDIYGLTFPLWCVGGDFNVIREVQKKLGGSRLTSSMRDFDSFIRESELLDPPLRNASFTWSNMQESPVCKRLDRFLYSNEWGSSFPKAFKKPYQKDLGSLANCFGYQPIHDKAPGPDGFTIAVFQDCWDVIKEDLVRVFAEFHRSGVINQSTNASFIVFLPKKRRLRGVLHETIHSTQGAFVQGRQIMDAVLIANEIVDERRRSGEEGVVFKIDFEKAYDHVRWDFLDQVLEKKGFSPRWRKWMSGCLSSVSYAVLVNGSAKGWVKASRGIKTRNPLSPFLFTLVADVLSRMFLRAEKRNMLESFKVVETEHRQGNIYGIDLDQAHISRLAETLECKASGWPILHLGLPLGGKPQGRWILGSCD